MRGESHRQLGIFLARHYLGSTSRLAVHAFELGCIQPDRNPATYLKGSLRYQWLRGHNYRNAAHFVGRISRRLERKRQWSLLDYYTLGKLIHYTADAFTYAHNDTFPTRLADHITYEHALQEYFLVSLKAVSPLRAAPNTTVMGFLDTLHRSYETHRPCIQTDTRFTLIACCSILSLLTSRCCRLAR